MSRYVIDASAMLAVMRDEPGADFALARMADASMSAVNWSECLMRGAEKGLPVELMRSFLATQMVRLVPFNAALAVETALLRPLTKNLGLSFADRACLATAKIEGAIALTADRAWATLSLPCSVELIR